MKLIINSILISFPIWLYASANITNEDFSHLNQERIANNLSPIDQIEDADTIIQDEMDAIVVENPNKLRVPFTKKLAARNKKRELQRVNQLKYHNEALLEFKKK